MNRLKALTPTRLKILLIALPVSLALLYYSFIAADRYVSEATVALRQAGTEASAIPGAALLLAGISPPSREDNYYLREYIHSLGLLQRLDAKLKLRQHFESERLDVPNRLSRSASQEEFLEHYRSHVEVSLDELSSMLTIRTQGFKPEFAQRLNQAVLDESERFVNELSHKLAREKLSFAEAELGRAAGRLQQAKTDVLAFQAKHKLLDPTVQAHFSGTVSAEMQAAITRSEAELRQLKTYLNEDSYQVRALQGQIDATRAQLEEERTRATGAGKQSDKLGALAIEFKGLEMKAEFALDAYKVALAAVENGRIDAIRKMKNLVVIQPPTLPQTAQYPRRLYSIVTVLVACLLLYGVVRLVIATVREHQD